MCLGFAMPGRCQGCKHALPFAPLAAVWLPSGQADGMAPHTIPVPARPART